MSNDASNSSPIASFVIAGLLLGWAILLAVGTLLYNGDHDWRRSLFILGTIGVFVTVWGIALLLRRVGH